MNEWRNTLYYPYQANEQGEIRNSITGKILKPAVCKNGYHKVQLMIDGKPVTKLIHRIVWESFYGPIPKGMQINHINEIKTDNRLCNIELCTPKYNTNFGSRNTRVRAKLLNGPCSKPIVQFDKNGTFVKEWPSVSEAVRGYGRAIEANLIGRLQTAYGYIWKHKDKDCLIS